MEETKFVQMCKAYYQAQQNYDDYQKSCHEFSIALVDKMKKYYQIPEAQFSLYTITEEGEFDLVPDALIHALSMTEDHYWHFGMGITVNKAPETLPEELILVHLVFRKDQGDVFHVKYPSAEVEYKIVKEDESTYIDFFDALFKMIIDTYNNQILEFTTQKTTRKLGFLQKN